MYVKRLLIAGLLIAVKSTAQQHLVDSICSQQNLQRYVSALANDSMQGRLTGTNGNSEAANYIATQFDNIGLKKVDGFEGYFHPVRNSNNTLIGNNIIGVLPGKDSILRHQLIIFSAHYDHIGKVEHHFPYSNYSQVGDSVFNGANDNATGVAGVLALAKYFQVLDSNKYTLLFIAFTGEELGMVGSRYFVGTINTKVIKYVINLEMLGRPTKNSNPYICYSYTPKLVHILNRQLRKVKGYNKNYFTIDPFPTQYLGYRSDHYSFEEKNVCAITIMNSPPTDKYYHSNDDELQTIDFIAMQLAVRAIALAVTPIVNEAL